MIKIEGYRFTGIIHEGAHTVIYGGTRQRDNLPVAAKSPKAPYPSPQELNRLDHEYNIGKDLNIPGVVKYYALEQVGYGKAIIMENFGAISLARYIRSHPVDLKNTLQTMMALTDILGELHRSHIIHKDINPYNILINPETRGVKIADFSISSRVKRETQPALEPENLKGTLAYVSPEQTGRMNRSIDFRTDFYSLGATYYEMLTGKRPFELDDPMELVHAHMAREAAAPHEVNDAVPAAVSRIVIKLISKNAEDRYQSAAGLKADLEECYRQFLSGGGIEAFTVGTKDISDRFLVPEKLYGRERETAYLVELFNGVAEGKKGIVFFSGPPGIGKSTLINEIHKPAAEKRAYFITGKYDQFERNLPNRAIIQAFSALTKQLLSSESDQLEKWKAEIQDAVGNNGQVLIDMLPRMELIIGRQPEVPILPPMETQNRVDIVFRDFIKVFARKEHPLVLFLDDLQWADDASLLLIDTLFADPELNYFLLVGAYREREADGYGTQSLGRMIEKWRTAGAKEGEKGNECCKEIKLNALDTRMIGRILADAFHCTGEKTKKLADLVYSKTDGNPFFVHEFLKKLQEDHLVEFKEGWTWDVSRIQQADITDNVAELMTDKLKKLPPHTLAAVKIAACVGVTFPLGTVARAAGKTVDETSKDLKKAVDEGILLKSGDEGKFSHTRVQEVAYSLAGEEEQRRLHLEIGKEMWAEWGEQNDETLFDLANHLNRAGELLNEKERGKLARINLQAGRKAKASIAYEVAYRFFKQGLDLLAGADEWGKDYELALALYTEGGEAGYLAGKNEEAEGFFSAVQENAKKLLDKIKVYEIKIHICMGSQKFSEALQLGREALGMLGMRMPQPQGVGKWKILKEFMAVYTRLKIKKGGTAALVDLPELTDPHKLAAARILTSCTDPAYVTDSEYFALIVLKLLNLTLKNGNCEYSAYAYAVYGGVSCDLLGNIDKGYRLGNLGLRMLEKFNAGGLRAKIYYVYGAGIHHWKKHMRGDLTYLLESYKSGAETGDLKFASYSIDNYLFRLLYVGEPLPGLKKECGKYIPVVRRFRQLGAIQVAMLWDQVVLALIGDTEDKYLIKGEIAEKISFVSQWMAANDMGRLMVYTMGRLILLYIYGHFESAVDVAEEEKKYVKSVLGDIHIKEFYFYYSLALLAHYPQVDKKRQKKYLKRLEAHQRKMKKWAAHAPENFRNKYLIIEAGRCELQGKVGEAVKLYSQSVYLARQSGFNHEEAVACECAARFYLNRRIDEIASVYMKKALYLYSLWGAKAKVRQLENRYPELLAGPEDLLVLYHDPAASPDLASTTPTPRLESAESVFDLETVLRASQTISREIILTALLKKMMRIVVENSGADRAFFLMEKQGELRVEAEAGADEGVRHLLQEIPLEDPRVVGRIPVSVIHYVARTREYVILDDAARKGEFTDDPCIKAKGLKSLLCAPIIGRGKLSGILYLENSLTAGAFTPERVKVMQMLASQVAISIENARLYRILEESEEKYRSLHERAIEGIFQASSQGRIISANPALSRIMGYDPSDDLSSIVTSLARQFYVDPEDRRKILGIMAEKDRVVGFETRMRRKDGVPIWVSISAHAVRDPRGNLLCIEGTLVDITERIEKENAQRERKAAEAASRAKSEFLANMSHEIRTPMNAILGFTEIIKSKIKEPQLAYYLQSIHSSGKSLLSLIDDILDLSKVEAGKLNLEYSPVSPQTLFNEMRTIFGRTIRDKGLRLIIKVPPRLPGVLLLDETRLRQVLINLVGNAVKFTESGHIKLSAQYRYPDKNDRRFLDFGFSIEDTGMGIPDDQRETIFSAFNQLKGQRFSKFGGTGLGLTITKRLVETMKGEINVESEVGRGSTFHIVLKGVRVASSEALKARQEKSPDPASIRFENSTVLVADDIETNRQLIKGYLEGYGLTLLEAETGREIIEQAGRHHPQLILLDIKMPEIDGYKTAHILKKEEGLKDIPVIAVTALALKKDKEEIIRLCDAYIKKPFSRTELVREIMKFLPHTVLKGTADTESTPREALAELSPASLARHPELLKILKTRQSRCLELSELMAVDKIEAFAEEMKKLGEEYEYQPLAGWSDNLLAAADAFDIDSIEGILRQLQNL